MPRIKVTGPDMAEGRLKEIYDELIGKRGKLAAVHQIQSLRPESIALHMDLYLEIMFSRSGLSRAEREMMAVVVSSANGCGYCKAHHGEALNHYWKDTEKVDNLATDFLTLALSPREMALCRFARLLTLNPMAHEDHDHTDMLRKAGLSDADILDAVLVIAYFNFVNRIVLSLGVELEEHQGKGFKY
ncbi:MAG: peroxidase-related enzyme [Bacteroidales bacterium]